MSSTDVVRWQSREDHVDGFRGSKAYAHWRKLLHQDYDPFPTLEYYEHIMVNSSDLAYQTGKYYPGKKLL